jgi:Asp-tRNA(Asn)/Glu-tRNA(Gln) amidotransferase A subunit family amidase
VALALLPSWASPQAPRSTPGVEVFEASAVELQRAMTDRRTTAAALVDAYLARIAAFDQQGPALNAMIRLNPRARAEAAALDAERRRGRVRGPLHGIPIILKDNFDTRGWATSAGSLALATHVPLQDGFVVRRLREAGAVIIGKSNMHELAAGITTISSLGGQTRNPYDPARCPGGSSGGTGAAIAASFAAIGWGTDTCGSIRIPAAYGSLFGLRPTQGLVSRDGIVPLALTQDIAGPLARTVTDLAIALDAVTGPDAADPATAVLAGRPIPRFADSLSRDALRGARLGLLRPYFRNADSDVADTVRSAARALQSSGAEVIDVNVADFDSLLAGSGVILLETKFDLVDYLARTPAAPVKSLGDILARGLYHSALESRHKLADTVSARDTESRRRVLARQAEVRSRIIALMDSLRLDALVYPTMTRRPALVGEAQPGSNCALAAQTGLPAITAPAGFTADGLPVGIELLGRPFSDVRLVAFAYAFEQAGARRRPPTTTPRLVNGRAPAPVTFAVTARAGRDSLRGSFAFDVMRNELAYRVRVHGAAVARIAAIVLRRADSTQAGRVIHRLAGPGGVPATGRVSLSAIDRGALRSGRLMLSLFLVDRADAAAEARMALPPRRANE